MHGGVRLADLPDLTSETYEPDGMIVLYGTVMEVVTRVDQGLALRTASW